MAASVRHVGHYVHKNSRFLFNNVEQLWSRRGFGVTAALQQQTAEANKESTDQIIIPGKKTWSKEAVLEALASTVGRDPTAYGYQFQDDPYLTPRNTYEFKMFSLTQESGRSAAKYFVNSNPKFFTKDFAEPHIPCLMPETVSLLIEEVSEEALKERINLRKVTAAVEMYDQLLQAGTAVSMETTHDLLDLISLYCDKDPIQEGAPHPEEIESGEEVKKVRRRAYRVEELVKLSWKENNNAERIFNLLPERDTRCYSALIRGMLKHGAYARAFDMYTDMLNNRLTADVHIFNALIVAVPYVREKYTEKWDLVVELLNQMSQQKVQPNLLTFNAVLKTLRRCGTLGKTQAIHTIIEMKTLGIAPSLASFEHLLSIYYRGSFSGQNYSGILNDVLSELAGRSFTCQDPDDVFFFCSAIKICLESKDLELAYSVHNLLEVGKNWRMLGDPYQQSIYYGRFFNLICMMEHIDVVLKWYRKLIPSMFYPNHQCMLDLLQVLDTDSRLDMLPAIWKDIRSLGHEGRPEVVEELLKLMARDKHSPEISESFAACALDVKGVFDDSKVSSLGWQTTSLTHITSLLLRANKTQQAWEMLLLFKEKNRVPPVELVEEFLSVCHSSGSSQRAVQLVQLSSDFCLSTTSSLAQRTLAEFDLTNEQRTILSELELSENQLTEQ